MIVFSVRWGRALLVLEGFKIMWLIFISLEKGLLSWLGWLRRKEWSPVQSFTWTTRQRDWLVNRNGIALTFTVTRHWVMTSMSSCNVVTLLWRWRGSTLSWSDCWQQRSCTCIWCCSCSRIWTNSWCVVCFLLCIIQDDWITVFSDSFTVIVSLRIW